MFNPTTPEEAYTASCEFVEKTVRFTKNAMYTLGAAATAYGMIGVGYGSYELAAGTNEAEGVYNVTHGLYDVCLGGSVAGITFATVPFVMRGCERVLRNASQIPRSYPVAEAMRPYVEGQPDLPQAPPEQ